MGSDFETPACRGSRQKFHLGEVDFGIQLLPVSIFLPPSFFVFFSVCGAHLHTISYRYYPAQDSSPSDLPICAVGKAHSCSMYSDG